MATKSSKPSKTTGEKTSRKLALSKQTLKDLAPGTRTGRVKGGRLGDTQGCPKLGPA